MIRKKVLDGIKFSLLLIVFLLQFAYIPLVPKARAYANPAAVDLLTVDDFAALAATAVSSPIAGTVLNDGDLGINAGCTDFPAPCATPGANGSVVGGSIQNANGVATTGQTDATAVVSNLNGRSNSQVILSDLGGLTLDQGVYQVGAAATNLVGTLTLSGNADSIFIFKMTSTLITSASSNVVLTGGVQACNVFWTVGSSATFNNDTEFVGTVIASTSVTFPGGGGTLNGRVVAQSGAITFNNTTVNNTSCAAAAVVAAASSSTAAASSSDDDDDASDNGGSKNGYNGNICVAVTPLDPQWATRQQVDGGVNLTWSAMGGDLVEIEVTNANGEYEFRYVDVPNDGYMFIPGVSASQLIRIRVVNLCETGGWLLVSAVPMLPNTGFNPAMDGI